MNERQSQSFSIHGSLLSVVRAMAAERGESMSFIVRDALREYIQRHAPDVVPLPEERVVARRRRR